ncbi:MAG: hypothetical protein JW820_20495 [Spirochaetales bacterium]|nr:hypothetical protein [Spirochaetales bacterium]
MKVIPRDGVDEVRLPGRIIQKVVGKDGLAVSSKMTMGFARYSADSGPMEPHQHAEEICYVIAARNGRIRYGDSKERLENSAPLEAGTTLHVDELEWHVFEYDEGGFVDIIFFYGQVDNIRPEEIQSK